MADYLVRKSVWGVGGDGWAYDIGYGGLDHVLAMGRDVNLLVLDTGVYSNTGGQASKATPMAATAKFAMGGKDITKKDLGLMAMAYGHVYVAQVAFGAKDNQTVRAFTEAESYPGTSIIIAYSHCIAHGYNLSDGLDHQQMAVETGLWPLYRFDPRRAAMGENPLKLDSKAPKIAFDQFANSETRFRMLQKTDPERAKKLLADAQRAITARFDVYQQLASLSLGSGGDSDAN
jgi:pyruvate-ferredoxin/flavodoxin oxidoreductase